MRDTVSTSWGAVALVCRTCSKRAGGGFGAKGRTPLAKALRRLLPKGKKRKAAFGVVETGCLGLCPKNAVVALNGARPGEWLLVGTGERPEDVALRLGLPLPIPPIDEVGAGTTRHEIVVAASFRT